MTSNLRANDSELLVTITSLTIGNSLAQTAPLSATKNNFTALIDTSLPFSYLPASVCSVFEQAFGLQWNATAQVYTVNATNHQKLVNLSPSITFTLGTLAPGPGLMNITLPYSAFDLGAAYPIFSEGTSYFPLRQANSSSQIILGRAFMQEAYVFVDYEKSTFTISQASFPSNANVTNIVTVNHSSNPPPSNTNAPTAGSSGLSKGAIAGIALGTSAALGLLGALAFFIWRSKHPRRVDEIHRASPSGESSDSSREQEKGDFTSYSPPPAFQSFRTERERQGAFSPDQEKGLGKKEYPASEANDIQSRAGTLGHAAKAPSTSTSPISLVDRPQGRVVNNVNPWENSELEDPRSPAGAASIAGVGTSSSLGMRSLMDEKPLPLTPVQMQELPGSSAAKEIHSSKEWDFEPGTERGISRNGGTIKSNSSSRNGWYGQSQSSLRESNMSPINGSSGDSYRRGSPRRQDSKSSLGSSITSRPANQRQKHIFELQADEPSIRGPRSRRESERKRSTATTPTSPR